MIKRLSLKGLISYEKYYGVEISKNGKSEALAVIRKHRLWETFLVEKLGFNWDEVHEVAEQLEHIQSTVLIEKLDAFLGNPSVDPHGHPIPDKHGKVKEVRQMPLTDIAVGKSGQVCSVKNSSSSFLQYLNKIGIQIGVNVIVVHKEEFDGSMEATISGKKTFISKEVAENILVRG
jgi:DtxR family Mn-dependent transcriptional regulator